MKISVSSGIKETIMDGSFLLLLLFGLEIYNSKVFKFPKNNSSFF